MYSERPFALLGESENKQATPFFSIVIPTHNRPNFVRLAVNSILSQSFSNYEIIVCDNSDNELTNRIFSSDFKNCKIIYNRTTGLSQADNFDFGYKLANGKFILTLLDTYQYDCDALLFLSKIINKYKYDVYNFNHLELSESMLCKEENSIEFFHKLCSCVIKNTAEAIFYKMCITNLCFSQKIISTLIQKYNRIADVHTVDLSTGIIVTLSTKTFLRIDKSLYKLAPIHGKTLELRSEFVYHNAHDLALMKNIVQYAPVSAILYTNVIVGSLLYTANIFNLKLSIEQLGDKEYFMQLFLEYMERKNRFHIGHDDELDELYEFAYNRGYQTQYWFTQFIEKNRNIQARDIHFILYLYNRIKKVMISLYKKLFKRRHNKYIF